MNNEVERLAATDGDGKGRGKKPSVKIGKVEVIVDMRDPDERDGWLSLYLEKVERLAEAAGLPDGIEDTGELVDVVAALRLRAETTEDGRRWDVDAKCEWGRRNDPSYTGLHIEPLGDDG